MIALNGMTWFCATKKYDCATKSFFTFMLWIYDGVGFIEMPIHNKNNRFKISQELQESY
jgi:hypothetical protein